MEKSIKITSIITGTIIILALLIVYTIVQLSPNQTNTLTTNGMAEISVIPNEVSLYFNVETTGADSKTANDKNSEIVNNLIDALVAEGFSKEDIQTTNFNIYEDFDWTQSGRKSLGYKATHTVVVKMSTNEADKIGSAIDAGVNANATLSYINFELSQELKNQYKAEAIKLAAEDARVKAEAMADGLDRKVGGIISVSDSSFNYNPWRMYAYDTAMSSAENMVVAKEATTSIQPSEQTISAQVSVVYRIR